MECCGAIYYLKAVEIRFLFGEEAISLGNSLNQLGIKRDWHLVITSTSP